MKRKYILSFLLAAFAYYAAAQNTSNLHILCTSDVHGQWFGRSYLDDSPKSGLNSLKCYVDSLREAVGKENVLFLDAGDNLQGDNAAYYANRIASQDEPHLFPRIAEYMGYDAIAVGNHDIETGHQVYDKVHKELEERGIYWLGGNVIKTSDGSTYFPLYQNFYRAGLKVTVIGFTNPNIPSWLAPEQYEGMSFLSLLPYAQGFVDYIREREKPQVLIVCAHTSSGEGDGKVLEAQGIDLFSSLRGVDLLIGGHDHQARVEQRQDMAYLNPGARARNIGHAVITIQKKGRKMLSKNIKAEIISNPSKKSDPRFMEVFGEDFEKIKACTLQEVGDLAMPLESRKAYLGMCDYINFLHTVQLSSSGARLSFAAPLSYDAKVKAGKVIFNDLFSIYPYENKLYVVNLTGEEIRKCLEISYDNWIGGSEGHVLKIADKGNGKWGFENSSFNFDSAGGLNYTVDVSEEFGSRVKISSFSDGSPFDLKAMYPVAMTSYRASGGGEILEAAGLSAEILKSRIQSILPEIRDLVYAFISSRSVVEKESISDPKLIGSWEFVPSKKVQTQLQEDFSLLFGARK